MASHSRWLCWVGLIALAGCSAARQHQPVYDHNHAQVDNFGTSGQPGYNTSTYENYSAPQLSPIPRPAPPAEPSDPPAPPTTQTAPNPKLDYFEPAATPKLSISR